MVTVHPLVLQGHFPQSLPKLSVKNVADSNVRKGELAGATERIMAKELGEKEVTVVRGAEP
jgi:hypothetical protein